MCEVTIKVKFAFALAVLGALWLASLMIGSYLIRYRLDTIMLSSATSATTNENGRYTVTRPQGDEIVIRHYGSTHGNCLVFFGNRSSDVPDYETALFKPLQQQGFSVYALSYPGQDGAKGTAQLDDLMVLVHLAVLRVRKDCDIQETLFFGRAFGANIAADAAANWHPKGLLLEDIAPSLAQAVRSHLQQKWYLFPLRILPVETLLTRDYYLTTPLRQLSRTEVAIVQGHKDPFMTPAEVEAFAEQLDIPVYDATETPTGDHQPTGSHTTDTSGAPDSPIIATPALMELLLKMSR